MSDPDLVRLIQDVVGAGLCVNSGVYSALDPSLSMRLNERGEYEYVGLDANYGGSARKLLEVSAFGGVAADEDAVARRLFGMQEAARHDPIAGYYVGAFAGWTTDSELRTGGSSGGITTWLLVELLRSGEIDGVVHLKPGGADGQLFTYQISRTEQEIRAGAKSRYFPGELSSVLREIREVPGRYAIVGIPSFIYEVRLLQEAEPVFRERIVYLIGLVCGHQKTANYATYLAWRAGIRPGDLKTVDFRKKVAGEAANRYSTEFTGRVGNTTKTWVVPQTELFGTDWGLGFFKANFSDFTQDALNETADVVLGDAWLPQYTTDGRGTNVILVRNQRLLELLALGTASERLHLESIAIELVIRSQTSLVRQSISELPYRFQYLTKVGQPTPRVRRRESAPLSTARKLIQRARLRTSRTSHTAYLAALQSNDLADFDRIMRPLAAGYRTAQRAARLQQRFSKGPRALVAPIWRKIKIKKGT